MQERFRKMLVELYKYSAGLIQGAIQAARSDNTGALVTADGHGRYQEAVRQGSVWSLSTAAGGVTVAAANVFSASAGSPIVGIFNPSGSGKNCVILRASTQMASGTAGAGGWVWGYLAANAGITAGGGNGAINNGTLITGGSTAKTFTGSAWTGGGAGLLLRFIGGPTTGAGAANANLTVNEETAGDIIVPPGGAVGIFAAAAGTSPIVMASMTWEEVAA